MADIFGEADAALRHNQKRGVFDGILHGAQAPGYFSGVAAHYPPHWGSLDIVSGDFSTAAGTLYYIPIYFREKVAFTGLKMRNLGAGDNAEVLRLGVYRATLKASGLRGLPSTLLVDAGEITLTGAAADNTLATAFTPDYVGWHWLAYHANTVADVMGISGGSPRSTAAGQIVANITSLFGTLLLNPSANSGSGHFGGLSVTTAYAALAATAVAPTTFLARCAVVVPYIT